MAWREISIATYRLKCIKKNKQKTNLILIPNQRNQSGKAVLLEPALSVLAILQSSINLMTVII